jgi:hypothetical protein
MFEWTFIGYFPTLVTTQKWFFELSDASSINSHIRHRTAAAAAAILFQCLAKSDNSL